MLFVNRIATVLHGVVAQCNGAANKNIGDAFLLTWKLEDEMAPADVCALADQALYSFVRTIAEMSRYQHFFLNFSLAATHRLFQRMPGYKVKMGFGLHYGWAIEGAIGSNKKIDASYISPHVNMSEFLESSTKEYGVCILMSEAFHNLLSDEAKYYCRQVDCIKKKKSDKPFGLYTYDMDAEVSFYMPDAARKRASMSQEAIEAIAMRFARRFSSLVGNKQERSKENSAVIMPGPITQQPVRPLDPEGEDETLTIRSSEEKRERSTTRRHRLGLVIDAAVSSNRDGLKRRGRVKSSSPVHDVSSPTTLTEPTSGSRTREHSHLHAPLFGQSVSPHPSRVHAGTVEQSSRGSLVLDIGSNNVKGSGNGGTKPKASAFRKRANGRAKPRGAGSLIAGNLSESSSRGRENSSSKESKDTYSRSQLSLTRMSSNQSNFSKHSDADSSIEKANLDKLLETAANLEIHEPPEGSATEFVSRLNRQESIKNTKIINKAIDDEVEARKQGKLGPASGANVVHRIPSTMVLHSGEPIDPSLVNELADIRERRAKNPQFPQEDYQLGEGEEPDVKLRPYTKDVWSQDKDLIRLQHKRTEEFVQSWNKAFQMYIHGHWEEAEQLLFDTYRISNQEDGPTRFLLKLISENNGTSPLDWAGYRVID